MNKIKAIIEERCKGCNFCIEFCPKKVLEKADKFNERGVNIPKIKNGDNCIGCGLCYSLCPDLAIILDGSI